jgi:hypothetical protein
MPVWDGGTVARCGEDALPAWQTPISVSDLLSPPGLGQLAADPAVRGRVSACRPGPEHLRVPYCPDVLDPVACDAEREYRHDAVQLGCQAGWPLAMRSRIAPFGCYADDRGVEAGDLLAAFGGRRAAVTSPPPSAVTVASGSRMPMRAPMSLASQAFRSS